jgi:hypothetical protein
MEPDLDRVLPQSETLRDFAYVAVVHKSETYDTGLIFRQFIDLGEQEPLPVDPYLVYRLTRGEVVYLIQGLKDTIVLIPENIEAHVSRNAREPTDDGLRLP